MSDNRLVLIFVFNTKPSYHDIEIFCLLVEEEFHLCKHNMKTIQWSEKFAVDIKKEEVNREMFS